MGRTGGGCLVALSVAGLLLAGCRASRASLPHESGVGDNAPVTIEIAYSTVDAFFYYRLQTPRYDSTFRLLYLQTTTEERTALEPPFLLQEFEVSGTEGRTLTQAFSGLGLSWDADQYWYRPTQEELRARDVAVPCGAIRYNERTLLACPVEAWASARQSPDANRLAWFIERLEVTRVKKTPSNEARRTRERLTGALLELFQRLPPHLVVAVRRDSGTDNATVDIGATLRWSVAGALVYGGFLTDPLRSPQPEIRRRAVGWYSTRSAGEARAALLRALSDEDPEVRASAASLLAPELGPNDQEALKVLREFINSEKDPQVRKMIIDLLPPQ